MVKFVACKCKLVFVPPCILLTTTRITYSWALWRHSIVWLLATNKHQFPLRLAPKGSIDGDTKINGLRPTCLIWLASVRNLIWGFTLTEDHILIPEEVVLHNRDHCIISLIFIHYDAVNLLLLFKHKIKQKIRRKMQNGRHFPKWPPCPTLPWIDVVR